MDMYEAIYSELFAAESIYEAVIGLIASLATYIMYGIAYYRMADKLGIPNGWLAFIPFGNVYILGKIADADEITPKHTKRLLISEVVTLVLGVLMALPLVAVVDRAEGGALSGDAAAAMLMFFVLLLLAAAIVNSVFCYIAYYRICENFAPDSTTGYFLGILLGGMCCSSLIPPILMLVLSGNEPGSTMRVTYTEVPPSDDVFRQ